ncbi:hypothetical protein JCM3765_003777 [Sporobolomyces pararoseus]
MEHSGCQTRPYISSIRVGKFYRDYRLEGHKGINGIQPSASKFVVDGAAAAIAATSEISLDAFDERLRTIIMEKSTNTRNLMVESFAVKPRNDQSRQENTVSAYWKKVFESSGGTGSIPPTFSIWSRDVDPAYSGIAVQYRRPLAYPIPVWSRGASYPLGFYKLSRSGTVIPQSVVFFASFMDRLQQLAHRFRYLEHLRNQATDEKAGRVPEPTAEQKKVKANIFSTLGFGSLYMAAATSEQGGSILGFDADKWIKVFDRCTSRGSQIFGYEKGMVRNKRFLEENVELLNHLIEEARLSKAQMADSSKSHQLHDRVQVGNYFLHFAALSGRFIRGQEFDRLKLVSDGWAAAVLLHYVYQHKLKNEFKLVGKLLTKKIVSPRDLILESIAMAMPESLEDGQHAKAFYEAIEEYWEGLCQATHQIQAGHLASEMTKGLSHEIHGIASFKTSYANPLEEEHINDIEKVLVKVMMPVAFSTSRKEDYTFGFSRSVVREDPKGEDAILDPSIFFASRLHRLRWLLDQIKGMKHMERKKHIEEDHKHQAYQAILQMTLYFVSLPAKKPSQPTYQEDAMGIREACDRHGCLLFGIEEYRLHRQFLEDHEGTLMQLFKEAAVWWCGDSTEQASELGKVGLEMKKWLYALYDVQENVHPDHHAQQSLARSRLARTDHRDAFSVVSRRDI